MVPGLLQTPDYARVRILSSWSLSAGVSAPVPAQRPAIGPVAEPPAPQEPETEVAARLARQAILTRAPDPPRYEAILDEQALTGRGAPDEVRDAQLVHLADLALLPNVTIRVLPRTATVGRHFVPYTGFSIYHFPDPGDPETVAVETLARELVLTDRNSVDRYATVFGWLTDAALDPIRSRSWISARIEDSRRK
ncbi:DUF5753 domain-containing protein [Catellatospora bangladeshensis]|uniref:DUF5753 domain-containing protein n=1 Tax=Catellatospora bangladeshensis TaxID=310355 RepID=UPI003621E4F3